MVGVGSGGMSDCLCLTRGMLEGQTSRAALLWPREGQGEIPSGEIGDVRRSKVQALCAFPPLAVDLPFPLNLSEARPRRASRQEGVKRLPGCVSSRILGRKARLSPPEAARMYPVWITVFKSFQIISNAINYYP